LSWRGCRAKCPRGGSSSPWRRTKGLRAGFVRLRFGRCGRLPCGARHLQPRPDRFVLVELPAGRWGESFLVGMAENWSACSRLIAEFGRAMFSRCRGAHVDVGVGIIVTSQGFGRNFVAAHGKPWTWIPWRPRRMDFSAGSRRGLCRSAGRGAMAVAGGSQKAG